MVVVVVVGGVCVCVCVVLCVCVCVCVCVCKGMPFASAFMCICRFSVCCLFDSSMSCEDTPEPLHRRHSRMALAVALIPSVTRRPLLYSQPTRLCR